MRTYARAAVLIVVSLVAAALLAALVSNRYLRISDLCHLDGGNHVNGVCQKVMP